MLCNACDHNAVCMYRSAISFPACVSNIDFDCTFYTGVDRDTKTPEPKLSKEELREVMLASRPTLDMEIDGFVTEETCDECGMDYPPEEISLVGNKAFCRNCRDIYVEDKVGDINETH